MNNAVKKHFIELLFFILLDFFTVSLCAKDFKILDTSNGLPDNTVKCFTQDSRGFMWLGTFNGLCRFDGAEFVIYRHDKNTSNSIVDNHVEALLSVGDYLWVGTTNGLSCYSQKEDLFYDCVYLSPSGEKKRIDVAIRNIICCNGLVFVLTTMDEIWVQKEGYVFIPCVYGKKMSWQAIANYKENLFLAYSTEGLFLIDAQKQAIVNQKLLDKHILSGCMMYYSQNQKTVYVGAGIGYAGRAFKINSELAEIVEESFALKDIKAIVDYQDKVLFGLDGGGIVELKDGEIVNYTSQNSNISSDAVHALFVDRRDCLWIGTYRGGVNFYSSYYDWFYTLTKNEEGLSHDIVTAIYPDGDKLYLGLDGGGLNIYDKKSGSLTVYSQQNSTISGNNILSICADSQYIWMAVYEKGLCRFSRTTHTFKNYDLFSIDKIYNANQVWDIQQGNDGNIWIIGSVVYLFNPKTESFTLVDGVYSASSILFDGDFVWISSTHTGLYKLDRKTRKICMHYHEKSEKVSLPSNFIRYMFMDSNHSIWLSTESAGLYRMDEQKGKIISYAERIELQNNKVVSIEEDGVGCLWLGTYNGLYKYDPKHDSFVHFGKMDNLWAGQFNYHACAQDNRFVYMGATKGLVWFEPQKIVYTHQTSPVYFTELELLNHSGSKVHLLGMEGKSVSLAYNQNFFTLFFSVPEMLTPDKVRFSCYMKGFEKGWQEIGTKRQVSYTNVPPGKYVFYVKSTDSSGKWSDKMSCLYIVITHPWWQTGWAWCLWILLLSGAIATAFWFYKHELNIKHLVQLKEIEKETARNINEAKLRFYTNITHELRTPIFLITAPLEELMTEKKRIVSVPRTYLMNMYRNAMKLSKLVTRMIDLRKLEQGKLKLDLHTQNVVSFCKDLVPDYESLCQQKNIIFHFLPAKTIIRLNFDAEKLEIILTNLVSNAFKYTPEGGKVVLVIDETSENVMFSVEDNGIGIEKEFQDMVFERFFQVDSSQSIAMGDGIGLSFVKYLVELHGGEVHLESEFGKGSKFMFSIPLKDENKEEKVEEVEVLPDVEKEKSLLLNAQPMSPTATHTLLLIDDEPEILELMERSLIEDFRILKANNGMDGLTVVRKELPDLIVCDVMMPKMDGMAFLEALKEDKELAHIPIIMLTAKIAEEDQIVAFDSGADAYLTKPVSLKFLRNRIDYLLARTESVVMANALAKSEKNYTKEEQRFLLKCKETIDEHLMNPNLGVVFMAEKLGMSHSSFYRKIKSVTGMSGMDFINEYKVFKAVQLFNGGETNVSSVCVKCGFNDIKSFRDAFKKKMNISPKQYVMQLSLLEDTSHKG